VTNVAKAPALAAESTCTTVGGTGVIVEFVRWTAIEGTLERIIDEIANTLRVLRLTPSYTATKIPAYGASRIAEGKKPLKSSVGPERNNATTARGNVWYCC
jgi:hypothetical protein